MRRNNGQALIIVMIILVLAMVGLFALCTPGENDHGSLGRVELISHHRDDPCDYEDCSDDRDDRRGGKQTCFMACYIVIPNPVPGGQQPDRPESLVPPTPDKIIAGIQTMGDAGIKLGSTIAQLVIDYVVNVFRFLV